MAMSVSYSVETCERRRSVGTGAAGRRQTVLLKMTFTALPIHSRRKVFRQRREATKASRRDSHETR
jgi:hypothetical protein